MSRVLRGLELGLVGQRGLDDGELRIGNLRLFEQRVLGTRFLGSRLDEYTKNCPKMLQQSVPVIAHDRNPNSSQSTHTHTQSLNPENGKALVDNQPD